MSTIFFHSKRKTYYSRSYIPTNLRQLLKGRLELWRSLGTADKDEASVRAAQWDSRIKRVFVTLKKDGQRMTQAQIDALVEHWLESALEEAEDHRATCGPLSDQQWEDQLDGLWVHFDVMNEALLSCDYRRVEREADELLKVAGLPALDHNGAEFGRLCRRPQAFANRLGSVSIASTFDIRSLIPHASHPLLDPYYSSSDLQIKHDGVALSRFEKTRIIADWELTASHLRVCNNMNHLESGTLNCGRCEKCVRTMLAFLALGILKSSTLFPVRDVSPELIESVGQLNTVSACFYPELLQPLTEIGRIDLVTAIRAKLRQYRRIKRLADLKERIRKVDNKLFHGMGRRAKRYLCKGKTLTLSSPKAG
jgi:hypothetical protein